MSKKHTISITEARKKIFEIAEDVQNPDTIYMLTDKGNPKAVVMSADKYEDMKDDLEIYMDQNLMAEIQASQAEYERGEYYTWDEVKKRLGITETQWVVAEKPAQKYNTKKRSK